MTHGTFSLRKNGTNPPLNCPEGAGLHVLLFTVVPSKRFLRSLKSWGLATAMLTKGNHPMIIAGPRNRYLNVHCSKFISFLTVKDLSVSADEQQTGTPAVRV